MKKTGILHAELNRQVALLGHTDRFIIADSGLPLPRTLPTIDLALTPGHIDFQTVLDALLEEVVVQEHIIATQTSQSPAGSWITQRATHLGTSHAMDHEDFKQTIGTCQFAVRTGEQTPYANIICISGVPF